MDALDYEELTELDFDDAPAFVPLRSPMKGPPSPASALSRFALRDYQEECIEKIEAARSDGLSRILAVLATGCGKTVIFSQVALREVNREVTGGGRVLILAHTDELLDQAIDKLKRSTGLDAEKEKAGERASPFARVVVASVQTLARKPYDRLTGFAEDHFSLVIVDEAHRSLAPSYQTILNYFHYGAASLAEDWKAPDPTEPYDFHARILGVTATADRGDKRSLGEFYQKCVFEYDLLKAVIGGYLVRPITINVPLQIDLRGVKVKRTGQGSDLDLGEVTQRITPFLREIARNIAQEAGNRKTVVFMPGVEAAKLGAAAAAEFGLKASFVSGACPDRAEKLEAFNRAGPGSIIFNAMLLTEGWDCPDVSCVVVLRPTKIRSLYVQCVGRGTRTLPGLIDGVRTAEERRAAIAGSAKPDLLILDFLWLSDNLHLIRAIDLVATSADVRKKMADASSGAGKLIDLLDQAQAAELSVNKDLLKSLEKAAKEHQGKKARVIDPLAWALSLGDAALASWTPESKWDALEPLAWQITVLTKEGIDTSNVCHRGLAEKLIDRIKQRRSLGLCSAKQLNFMKTLGIDEQKAALLTIKEATETIDRTLALKKAARRQS